MEIGRKSKKVAFCVKKVCIIQKRIVYLQQQKKLNPLTHTHKMEKYIEIAEVRKHIKYDEDKADNAWTDNSAPCPCCGRPVKYGKGVEVHMVGGGSHLTLSHDDFGAGDMLWFEVGKNCYRTLEKLWKTATPEELHKIVDA